MTVLCLTKPSAIAAADFNHDGRVAIALLFLQDSQYSVDVFHISDPEFSKFHT